MGGITGQIFLDSHLKNLYDELLKEGKINASNLEIIEEMDDPKSIEEGGIKEKILISKLELYSGCSMVEIESKIQMLEEKKIIFVDNRLKISSKSTRLDLKGALEPVLHAFSKFMPNDLIGALTDVVEAIAISCKISSNNCERHVVKILIKDGSQKIVCILQFKVITNSVWLPLFGKEICETTILGVKLTLLKEEF